MQQRTKARGTAAKGRSALGSALLSDLLSVPPKARKRVMADLDEQDLAVLLATSHTELGTAYALWQGDPVGFVEEVLGDAVWSGQKRLLRSLTTHQQTAVPSAFGTGKTKSASLAAAYWACVYPPGTAVVVTIAPRWRQVLRQVWPEIRRGVTRAGLPGRVDQAQWTLADSQGLEHVVAYGIAAAPNSEDAVQGIHSPNLLLVVDEGGGIAPKIGRNMAGLMTGSNSRMLVIGNPPTDDEGSWFEKLCLADRVNQIRLSAYSTPAFTGEETPMCRSCPPAVPPHRLSSHLVDEAWVANAIEDHGPDSRYVEAKVHARFPKGGPNTLIPSMWVETAYNSDEPGDEAYVPLNSLQLAEERRDLLVRRGAWVRLGVDVAADGGDEVVVSRCVGDLLTIEHASAGSANANAVDVAGRVLQQIHRAQQLADRLGTVAPVRVKVDVIGVGWAVYSQLERWGEEGKHKAEIVKVDVRESVRRSYDAATLRPAKKRDELWLAMRSLLVPRKDGESMLRLRVDDRTIAQLSAPRYSTNNAGETVVESKDKMRARGIRSPDRAEAVCLAVYEPEVQRSRLLA
ncbi:hypothetical protein OOJ91_33745 [Micromonospora lupini]|uniref:hypothetical protein n=1 Tax=Micromonospora lupini TaxID=285679 RepID=UPI00225284AF|nr:hypothetical protein [Micromonospora lupini]MCX5070811.1 hypothetical protein [Micromonospora lupini]